MACCVLRRNSKQYSSSDEGGAAFYAALFFRLLLKLSPFDSWRCQKPIRDPHVLSCTLRSLINFFLALNQNSRFRKKSFLGHCCLVSLFLSSCQSPKDHLEALAKDSALNQNIILETSFFSLTGWGKNQQTPHANIYIEGDGQAWQDPWTISENPSPSDPMGFKLALADSRQDSILYLGRPCQYVTDKRCTPLDWTSGRFSQKVIDTYHQALNQIKPIWKAKTFTLHGYSGGATIALLIAAQRQDVVAVVAFAPLLDPTQWAVYHHYTPLSGSLSPLDFAKRLADIPQDHFIGLEDQQVPFLISLHYFAALPKSSHIKIHQIPQFAHHSDWPGFWKSCILKTK